MSVFQKKQDGTSNESITLLVPKGRIYHSFSQSILEPQSGPKQIREDLFDAKDRERNSTEYMTRVTVLSQRRASCIFG